MEQGFDIFNVLSMIGGLSLFLYGMNVMGDALAKMAGGKLEHILEKLTTNKYVAVLLGAGVTAVIQSSSATTVMVVGFVNSGIMKLKQAVGIIMGANIGTTITSWILSLSGISGDSMLIKLLKPTSFTPILALIGVVFLIFMKNEKKHDIGTILLGFAVLMFGMDAMSEAVKPLAKVDEFTSILTMFEHPLLGLLAGVVLTAIIQSSSASVGILQALCVTGAITYANAIPIIMGQNIGTCITAILSSIGASKDAKRASAVHLFFNVIGTTVFMILFYLINVFMPWPFLNDVAGAAGIAVVHTTFNVLATCVLLPMSNVLEKLATIVIKDEPSKEEDEQDAVLSLLDYRFLDNAGVAIAQSHKVAVEMAKMSKDAVLEAVSLIGNYNEEKATHVRLIEDKMDKYEDVLSAYLLKLSGRDVSKEDSHILSTLLHSVGDIERISDLSVDILLGVEQMHKKEQEFSKKATEELNVYGRALKDILNLTVEALENNDREKAILVEPMEDLIDTMNKELKKRHVKRLKKGKCTVELGISLSDITDTFERISDHCSNVAVCIVQGDDDEFEAHGYRKEQKADEEAWFAKKYEELEAEYALP